MAETPKESEGCVFVRYRPAGRPTEIVRPDLPFSSLLGDVYSRSSKGLTRQFHLLSMCPEHRLKISGMTNNSTF